MANFVACGLQSAVCKLRLWWMMYIVVVKKRRRYLSHKRTRARSLSKMAGAVWLKVAGAVAQLYVEVLRSGDRD